MSSFLKLRIVWIVPLLFLSILPASDADKEQREPYEPVFNAAAIQLAYREDVTKAGEILHSSSEIWVINRDGANARQLTSGFKDTHPRFKRTDLLAGPLAFEDRTAEAIRDYSTVIARAADLKWVPEKLQHA